MNYSNDEHMCRVDFFRPSGEWYCAEAVSFEGLYTDFDGYRKAIIRHLRGPEGKIRLLGTLAVCLEPALEHQYPRMLMVTRE